MDRKAFICVMFILIIIQDKGRQGNSVEEEMDAQWVLGVHPSSCSWWGESQATAKHMGPQKPHACLSATLPTRHPGSSEGFCAISCPFPTGCIFLAKAIKGKHTGELTDKKVENGLIVSKLQGWPECQGYPDSVCVRKASSRYMSRWWLYSRVTNSIETEEIPETTSAKSFILTLSKHRERPPYPRSGCWAITMWGLEPSAL